MKQLLEPLKVPIKGIISDGEETIRSAVAFVFPAVPHQLCQFHYLKDALKPFYEADRHAKTLLKKHLRGVRPIERALEEHPTPENDAIGDYCLAVRACLTDDGRSPLEASGLRLYGRLTQISDSIGRVQQKTKKSKLSLMSFSSREGLKRCNSCRAYRIFLLCFRCGKGNHRSFPVLSSQTL